MKFGYSVEAPIGWPELLEFACRLDQDSNFDSFWISDSLSANGPADEPRLEAWSALAAIAQATSRIRLGVMVSGNAYRHPAVLAKMVTTIDHISRGRVELGIGAGWPGENAVTELTSDLGESGRRVWRRRRALSSSCGRSRNRSLKADTTG